MRAGQWLRFAKGRWRSRKAYLSLGDVLKGIYLRGITEERGGKEILVEDGMWVGVSGLADRVWLRRRSSDFMVFQEIFESGEYRPILRWNLPTNATIVDLGGNVGLASAYFGSVLAASRIVVVEPDHGNCQTIGRTCEKMIADGRLKVVEAFAAARDGSSGIDRNARSWAFKMAAGKADDAGEKIACVSVPTLMRDCGIETIDLLKCDIEGAEAELFADCKAWIDKVGHLVVETHAPFKIAQLFRYLDAAGWGFETLSLQEDEKVGLAFLKRIVPRLD